MKIRNVVAKTKYYPFAINQHLRVEIQIIAPIAITGRVKFTNFDHSHDE